MQPSQLGVPSSARHANLPSTPTCCSNRTLPARLGTVLRHQLGPSIRPPARTRISLSRPRTTRVIVGLGLAVAVLVVGAQFDVVPRTFQKLRSGDPAWLAVAAALEGLSFWGYALVVAGTARSAGLDLPRRATWQIVLAGVAATRLLATAGAGGVAATTFALRSHGLTLRASAATVTAQLAIVYLWFVLLLTATGATLYASGHANVAVTVVPAAVAGVALVTAIAGRPALHRIAAAGASSRRRIIRMLAAALGTLEEGTVAVADLVRRRDAAVVGGALWWLADAAVLWACCQAFGTAADPLEVCMAYLLGQVANLLPIPGGLGVEAGLAGGLMAFGIPPGVAVLASLSQRVLSTWLPALPGAVALVALGAFAARPGRAPEDDPETRGS